MMKSPRKRKIKYWQFKDDMYEEWKDFVLCLGGSLRKGKNGKVYGHYSGN